MAKTLVFHLISHASGELIEMLARNAVAQLDGVHHEHKLWKRVRRMGQLPEILAAVADAPGFVLHSISDTDLREAIEAACARLGVPCQFALEPLVSRLADYAGAAVQRHASSGNLYEEDYYLRVEAMKYTLAHDDGLASDDLAHADVIIVGVSRATKTPTCMYLASRGIKAANVPLVPGVPIPAALVSPQAPLVVGLIVDAARLSSIRSARLIALHQGEANNYSDFDALRQELLAARRLFVLHGWPIIDVTNRSIEQTAAMIIDLLEARAANRA